MKYKTTKKEVLENYEIVIKVGYCDMEYLLQYNEPVAYRSGVYGWNCDIHEVTPTGWKQSVAIVTGYRPFGNQQLQDQYEVTLQAESRAMEVIADYNYSYESKKRLVTIMLQDLIEKLLTTAE